MPNHWAVTRGTKRGAVVADNLRRAIGDTPVLAWATGKKLEQPTIRRILIGETSPTEQMISKIAAAMGLEPWQLLVPGLDIRNPPVLREANAAERALYDRLTKTIDELGQLKEAFNTMPASLE